SAWLIWSRAVALHRDMACRRPVVEAVRALVKIGDFGLMRLLPANHEVHPMGNKHRAPLRLCPRKRFAILRFSTRPQTNRKLLGHSDRFDERDRRAAKRAIKFLVDGRVAVTDLRHRRLLLKTKGRNICPTVFTQSREFLVCTARTSAPAKSRSSEARQQQVQLPDRLVEDDDKPVSKRDGQASKKTRGNGQRHRLGEPAQQTPFDSVIAGCIGGFQRQQSLASGFISASHRFGAAEALNSATILLDAASTITASGIQRWRRSRRRGGVAGSLQPARLPISAQRRAGAPPAPRLPAQPPVGSPIEPLIAQLRLYQNVRSSSSSLPASASGFIIDNERAAGQPAQSGARGRGGECLPPLMRHSGDLQAASRRLKIDQLLRLVWRTRPECERSAGSFKRWIVEDGWSRF
uniref:HTH La-type RNA-binding domain-containing protein n=1 Tax=Macrostomum lignano TaxID=282301 RepID=A0A1I8IYY2_9PLAT